MMEKKLTAATERVAEGNLRNKRQYLPPVMEFTSFTLENGFALSVRTESLGFGYSVPGGDGENYADGVSTTEGLDNGISF